MHGAHPDRRDDSQRKFDDNSDHFNGAYNYSYSLTSYDLDSSGRCRGFSSIRDTSGIWHPFKSTQVVNPAKKYVLIEEQTVLSGPECADPTGGPINDGRWTGYSGSDRITARHNKRGDIGFGDGHVETVRWQLGLLQVNRSLTVSTAASDILRRSARSSRISATVAVRQKPGTASGAFARLKAL